VHDHASDLRCSRSDQHHITFLQVSLMEHPINTEGVHHKLRSTKNQKAIEIKERRKEEEEKRKRKKGNRKEEEDKEEEKKKEEEEDKEEEERRRKKKRRRRRRNVTEPEQQPHP